MSSLSIRYKVSICVTIGADVSTAADTNFLFTNQEYDPESDLYYMNARYYNPETGRFISRDPANLFASQSNLSASMLNEYLYANNNPLRYTDPSGESSVSIVDYLKSQNQDSSITARIKLAEKYGIKNYTGSGVQNKNLLDILRTEAARVAVGAPAAPVVGAERAGGGVGETIMKAEYAVANWLGEAREYNYQQQGNWAGKAGGFIVGSFGDSIGNLAKSNDTNLSTADQNIAKGFVLLDVATFGKGSVAEQGIKGVGEEIVSAFAKNGQLRSSVIANSKTIASGAGDVGTSSYLRQAERLANRYGGKASDWVKNVTREIFRDTNGLRYQPHYYINKLTNKVVEIKKVYIDLRK